MANAMLTNGHTRRFSMPEPAELVGGVEKSWGEFCMCVMKARAKDTPDVERTAVQKRLHNVYKSEYAIEKSSLSEGQGSHGGYLVPYEWAYGMMRDVSENSIFWPRAFVQPMATKVCFLPLPNPSTSQGIQKASNLFGGMVLQWKGSANIGETEPVFQQVELRANPLSGYQLASNQLAEDYRGLGAFLHQLITRAVENYTDQAFFMGVGGAGFEAQPLGIVNNPGTIIQARNTTATIVQADVAAMYKQILPGSIPRCFWAISPTANEKLANLTGLGGILYYLPGADGSAGLLYGRPFYITEKLPDVGTKGDIVLFDPSLYICGFRQLNIDFSDQQPTAFLNYQSVWRVTWYGDGVPMLQSSVTLGNQSTTKAAMSVVLSTL